MLPAILVYAIVLKAHTNGLLNWVWAGVLAAVVPYILTLIPAIILQSQHGPFYYAITREGLVILGLQILAGLGVFYWLEREEASYIKWLAISVLGGTALIFVVPMLPGLL